MYEQNMDLELLEVRHVWTKHGIRIIGSKTCMNKTWI